MCNYILSSLAHHRFIIYSYVARKYIDMHTCIVIEISPTFFG